MTFGRTLNVWLMAALAIGAAGFLTGITQSSLDAERYVPQTVAARTDVTGARGYVDARVRKYGPNALAAEAELARIATPGDVLAPVVKTEADHLAALERRVQRRAFEGAPPTIPHDIAQLAPPDCLVCHLEGARVAQLVAPKMSHERYDSCVQCHVVSSDPRPVGREVPALAANTFVGLATPGRGSRAWQGAPPTMPHSSWMKSDCNSCHGVNGALGIRTPHPDRQSCTQCHAPASELDLRPYLTRAGPGARGG